MLKDYLIVEKSALPDYFLKVVEARRLLESGVCQQVSGACEPVLFFSKFIFASQTA